MSTPPRPRPARRICVSHGAAGNVHLPYEADLPTALEAFEGRFLPVTRARYWAFSLAEAPKEADVMMVNHALTHVSVAAGVEWNPDIPDETPHEDDKSWG